MRRQWRSGLRDRTYKTWPGPPTPSISPHSNEWPISYPGWQSFPSVCLSPPHSYAHTYTYSTSESRSGSTRLGLITCRGPLTRLSPWTWHRQDCSDLPPAPNSLQRTLRSPYLSFQLPHSQFLRLSIQRVGFSNAHGSSNPLGNRWKKQMVQAQPLRHWEGSCINNRCSSWVCYGYLVTAHHQAMSSRPCRAPNRDSLTSGWNSL